MNLRIVPWVLGLAMVMVAVTHPGVRAQPLSDLVGPTPWSAPLRQGDLRALMDPGFGGQGPESMGGPSLSIGGAQLGLGMDVFDHRALEPSTAVSLELRLAWPSGGGTTEVPGLRPYAAFGPALFVLEPTDAVLPWRAGDPSVALGVKGGPRPELASGPRFGGVRRIPGHARRG